MILQQATTGERAAQAQAPGEGFSTSPASPAAPPVDFRLDAGQQSQEGVEVQDAAATPSPQQQEEPAEQHVTDGDQQQLSDQESDSFRMFSFKVVQCTNPDETHDWTECPFAHVGEKANRRDPRLFRYTGISCPDYRKGACKRGSVCPYAHGVFEVWLHPSRYRTQLCKDGPNCSRQVCFFAHGSGELRQVAPENLPVLEAGSTDGSEASSDAPGPAAGPPSSSSSDSDSSSDSGSSATATASCKGPAAPASASEAEVAAATAGGGSGTGSLGTVPTASKLRQLKPASLQQKQQQSLDWATAFSDPQLFMSRQASTASSVGSGSHASGLGLASFSSLGSQASLALSAATPGAAAAGQPSKPGLALPRGGGPGSRLLRVPLDIAVEAAAVAASAGVAPLPLFDTFGSLTDSAGLACPSPPLTQLHQQQALGALAAQAGDAAAAGPWSALLPPAPHIGSGGSPADVAAQAAAAVAAHVGLLRQLGSLPGGNPALAATLAAQQAAAAQQEMLHAALLQQQAAQQQQQQRDLMWTAAFNAASDVGLNPLTAAACADCAVQTAAAAAPGACGLPQPGCATPASQLQLLLQQHSSLVSAVHPTGLGLQHLQQQQQAPLAAVPGPADALFAHKQLTAAGGLLGGCGNVVVGGVPGMPALPECAAAPFGFY